MTIAEALKIFGLENLKDQDDKSLKKIYYHLAQKYHPDHGGSFELFIALQEAHLFLKKNLGKSQYESEQNYESNNESDSKFDINKAYNDLQARFNHLRENYNSIISTIDKYENIFNAQINIINSSNSSIQNLVTKYHELKDNLKTNLDQELAKLKKRYEKEWWEYILPTKKLTRDEYIQHSNIFIEQFNKHNQVLDEEFLSQMLKKYQGSFQDIVSLLSEV